jgi:hypothetical protein
MDAPRRARDFLFVAVGPVLAVAIYPAFNDDAVVWPW